MSKVKIQGHSSGTGTVTITAPNTNSDRTLTVPDITDTLVGQSTTDTLTSNATALTTRVNSVGGRKNLIINGGFDVWQRGTSQTSNGYGSDDRWRNLITTTSQSVSRQAFTLGQTDVPNNPKYFSRTVVSSVAGSSNYCVKTQAIEDVTRFSGKTVTLSFWAKADANKNIATEFYQNSGSGGSSADVPSIGVTTHNLTTTWQKFTVTVTTPSVSGMTLGSNNNDCFITHFWFDAGSGHNARTNSLGQQSGTFDIANVQLELGDQATDFEHRSYGEELALCQRYFYPIIGDNITTPVQPIGQGVYWTSTACYVNVQLPTAMRDRPTLTATSGASFTSYYGGYATNITFNGGDRTTNTHLELIFSGVPQGNVFIRGRYNTSFIFADAEL